MQGAVASSLRAGQHGGRRSYRLGLFMSMSVHRVKLAYKVLPTSIKLMPIRSS